MISIVGRKMVVPDDERFIGCVDDNGVERREFCLDRIASNGVDLAQLAYRIDLEFEDGTTDIACLDKEVDEEHIHLYWDIISSNIKEGNIVAQMRGMGTDGVVRFRTIPAHFRAAGKLDATERDPEPYLSEFEKMEAKFDELIRQVESGEIVAPIATGNTVGTVKPDGTTLAVSNDGTLRVIGGSSGGSGRASVLVTVPTEGWAGDGPYMVELGAQGITEGANLLYYLVSHGANVNEAELSNAGLITGIIPGNGVVTVSVTDIPTEPFDIVLTYDSERSGNGAEPIKLLTMTEHKALMAGGGSKAVLVAVPTEGWSEAPYTITIPVEGVAADQSPIFGLVTAGEVATADELEAVGLIVDITTGIDVVTITASAVPTVGFTIALYGMSNNVEYSPSDYAGLAGRVERNKGDIEKLQADITEQNGKIIGVKNSVLIDTFTYNKDKVHSIDWSIYDMVLFVLTGQYGSGNYWHISKEVTKAEWDVILATGEFNDGVSPSIRTGWAQHGTGTYDASLIIYVRSESTYSAHAHSGSGTTMGTVRVYGIK